MGTLLHSTTQYANLPTISPHCTFLLGSGYFGIDGILPLKAAFWKWHMDSRAFLQQVTGWNLYYQVT